MGSHEASKKRHSDPTPNGLLTTDQIINLRRVFDIYDRDKDGYLHRDEVEHIMLAFNQRAFPNELTNSSNAYGQICAEAFISLFAVRMTARLSKDIKEALKERDVDETYKLDLEDFSSEKVRKLFRVFDKDGDGFISTAELRHVTTMVGEKLSTEELDAMMNEADIDKDGRISFEEFGLMLIRHNHSN